MGVEHDDVRLLAGRQRADPAVQPEGAGAVDRRPLQRLARANRRHLVGRIAAQRVVADFLAAREQQRRLHLAEHVAGAVKLDIDAERRHPADFPVSRHHRVSDMVMQLDQRGRSQRRAAVHQRPKLAIGVAGAVNEVVVRPEQPLLGHARIAVRHDAILAAARVRGRDEAELARHADVVLDHLPGAPVGPQDRHCQRHQPVVAGQPALAQGFDAVARMRNMRERRPRGLAQGLGGAMGENRANAAVHKPVDRPLSHLQAGDIVAPIHERRHAGVDLRQRADQIADVIVLGLVERGEIAVNMPEIIGRHPFHADAAQRGFPRVHMRVDEPRHDDLVARIDRFVGGRVEIAAHRLDPVAAEQKLAALEIADGGIERHQPAASDQNALHQTFILPGTARSERQAA